MSLVGGVCVCVCICGCTCMIIYACFHMYLSRGGITSFSQPGLTERISAQFIFSVHLRKQWIPQVCKVLIWDPLKFSHHYKFNSTLCTLHSWRKGNNFIILHTVPPEQEALTNQEALTYQSFVQVFVEKWMLFKRTCPPGIVSAVVSAFSSRIIFINNFNSHIWLRSVYYSVNSI